MRLFHFIVVLSVQFNFLQALDILVVWPHIGISHYYVFEGLFKTLAAQGHNLTVITRFPQKSKLPNFREVIIVPQKGDASGREFLKWEDLRTPKLEMYNGPGLISGFAITSCTDLMQDEKVRSFIREGKSFDVALVESFNTNCQFGVLKAMNYKGPVVGLSSCTSLPWTNTMYAVPDNPAYIPNLFLDLSHRMSFLQRVENTVLLVVHKLMYSMTMRKTGNELSKKYLGVDILSDMDMEYNSSLFLSNTHFSFTYPRPLPPNVIEVGGIHIAKQKPLPKDLETYVENSPHGVIYMSMGSMLKGSSFPLKKWQEFLNAFGKLKQNVIWKWENETIEGKPDNVLLLKWVPQNDLLCHPNVRAFVTHGGLLGTLEAVNCGVPMLAIPQFGDQPNNAVVIESSGMGVRMMIGDATEKSILQNLKKILSEKYKNQAKEVSTRFKDRLLPPMKTAIYWINYVAKYSGAKFMRTAAIDMPFYQYYLLDVIALILTVIIVLLFIIYKSTKLVLCLIFGKKQKLKTN